MFSQPNYAESEFPLEIGDRTPPVELPDQAGDRANLADDDVSGRPVLLVFHGGGPLAAYVRELCAFRDRYEAFTAHGAIILGITRNSVEANRVLHAENRLPFLLLSDTSGRAFHVYGVPASDGEGIVTFVLDHHRRTAKVIVGATPSDHAVEALDCLARTAEGRPTTRLGVHPPVLVVPRALTMEDCDFLIDLWHRPVNEWETNGFATPGYAHEKGDFKIRNDTGSYGKVTQYVIRDSAIQRKLDAKIGRRVLPEIFKAYQTKVSQREDYIVSCYESVEGGNLPPHRDNPSPATRHRRFSMSIHLNAGAYEGGELRFREYGEQLYDVEAGSAIVWSCSLLHEALETTKGRRFALVTHYFGD
jgi:peroxiredoxin/predicted 2-oxoglutarate/Fe(II)-dependent dioxygenase YbiX